MDRRASHRERELASRLLAFEDVLVLDSQHCVNALDLAFGKLEGALEMLVGAAGTLALAERALHLAVHECSVLRNVQLVVRDDHLYLCGLVRDPARATDMEVNQGAIALLGNFLWLISSFLGCDLTLHLVRAAWPSIDRDVWVSRTDRGGE